MMKSYSSKVTLKSTVSNDCDRNSKYGQAKGYATRKLKIWKMIFVFLKKCTLDMLQTFKDYPNQWFPTKHFVVIWVWDLKRYMVKTWLKKVFFLKHRDSFHSTTYSFYTTMELLKIHKKLNNFSGATDE